MMTNGNSNIKYISGRFNMRNWTRYLWVIVILGSISPDFDHAFSLLTGNKEIWGVLHQPCVFGVVCGICLASVIGLVAALDIRRNDGNSNK